MTKDNQKRLGRRNAAFKVREKKNQNRQPLEISGALRLFEAIDLKNQSKFGIIKLSQVDLNGVYEVPHYTFNPTTLISYAVNSGRDPIVGALLRAGADPTVRAEGQHISAFEHGGKVLDYLFDLPPAYAVWVINAIILMRIEASSKKNATTNQSLSCSLCMQEMDNILSLKACNHQTCENCLWAQLICGMRGDDNLRCPLCKLHILNTLNPILEQLKRNLTPKIKKISFEKWEALPQCLGGNLSSKPNPKTLPKSKQKFKFRAMHISEISMHFTGTTQSQRNIELFKAATTGSTLRLLALLHAGVHIDAQNEYGQTALFLAVYLDHVDFVRLLLEIGADATISTNHKITPGLLAQSKNDDGIQNLFINFVDEFSAHCSVQPIFGLSANSETFEDQVKQSEAKSLQLTPLFEITSSHPGAGSFYVDNCFPEIFLSCLELLFQQLPTAKDSKQGCNQRRYFFDSEGWVQEAIEAVVTQIPLPKSSEKVFVLPTTKFLLYTEKGAKLPPHVDLCKTDPRNGETSTHTLLLYLTDNAFGGETALLNNIRDAQILHKIEPRRGRLAIFPHKCPHEGCEVWEVPKLLLRGELYWS